MKGRSGKLILCAVLLVLVAGYFFRRPLFSAYCSFLVVQDRLAKSDLIVILGGSSGERTLQGVDLYERGYAPFLLFCGGKGPWRFTWGEVMRDLAVENGVPPEATIVEERARTTLEEALTTRDVMEKRGFQSVIVVSSPYHMRRVSLLFGKVFDGTGISLAYYPVQGEFMDDPAHQNHPELYYLEACKLLYSWKLLLPWTKIEDRGQRSEDRGRSPNVH